MSLDLIRIYLPIFTVYHIYLEDIAAEIQWPDFSNLIPQFIYNQQHSNCTSKPSSADLPTFYGKITIYPSAVTTFHVPSDISGIGGMCHECIHTVKSWQKGPGCYNTIFVNTDPSMDGMQDLEVTCVHLFFLFSHEGVEYPCALIHWFSHVGDQQGNTGMWIVELDMSDDGKTIVSIIHLDTIVWASHLLPVFSEECVSRTLLFTDTLNTFTRFYVNKYADHHAFEIAFWYLLIVLHTLAILTFQCWDLTILFTQQTCVLIMPYMFLLLIYLPLLWQPLGILTMCLGYCSSLLTNSLSVK